MAESIHVVCPKCKAVCRLESDAEALGLLIVFSYRAAATAGEATNASFAQARLSVSF